MDTFSEHSVSPFELCRVCATKPDAFVNIFEFKRNDKTMADYLSNCLQKPVHQLDGQTSKICFFCIPKLVDVGEFLITIRKSDQYFNGIFTSTTNNSQKAESNVEQNSELIANFGGAVNDPLAGGSVVAMKFEMIDEIADGPEIETEIETKIELITVQETEPPTLYSEDHGDHSAQMETREKQSGGLNFECHICHSQFTQRGLNHHMKIHDKKKFKCIICGAKFHWERNLQHHLCHGVEITCEYCPNVCHSTIELLEHLKEHTDDDNLRQYPCDRCKETFSMEKLRVWHNKKHESFTFGCTICGKYFERKHTLLRHCRSVHTDERRK